MNERPEGQTIFVESAARLHFGVLDLRGSLGRWFGGIGAAAPAPTLLVSATHADTLTVEGEDGERAQEFARRVVARFGMQGGARIRVHRALPSHAGLGSGTQLALGVARALAELYGLDTDAAHLAAAAGRGGRSAIGTWTFSRAGLVVEGGRRRVAHDDQEIAPLIARLPFPATWRCIVAVPHIASRISGDVEATAFAQLPLPPQCEIDHVAHLVLLGLLPALSDRNLPAFGAALTAIQAMNGKWFAPVQGGTFAPGPGQELVRRMTEWGAAGVGQSSWGPTVYGIVDGEENGRRVADRVRDVCSGAGDVFEGPFRNTGARVWREPKSEV